MKKKRSKIGLKYILVALTIICVAAIALAATEVVSFAPVRKAASVVIIPFQKGINTVGKWMNEKQASFKDVQELSAEVEDLKAKINFLEEENASLTLETAELESLRKLYDTDRDYANYEKIGATVIAKDPGNWYSTFTIDRGSNDGIEVDMNVLGEGGLVGIVTEVGSNWAKVKSIMDDTSNVSAMTITNFDTCIVSGDMTLSDEGLLQFEQMNTNNVILPGERVVTSNISDKYLMGIFIGTITEVNDDTNNLTKTGIIIPAVDFRHISDVLVIKEKKHTAK